MTEELRKRLEEAAEDYASKVWTNPMFLQEYNECKRDFISGAEYGYKEAIKQAKEWLKENKQVDMVGNIQIEERAVDACDNIPYNVYIHSSVNCEDAFKEGYIRGATEQKAIDTKEFINDSLEMLKAERERVKAELIDKVISYIERMPQDLTRQDIIDGLIDTMEESE